MIFLSLYDLLLEYEENEDKLNTVTIEGRGKNVLEAVELALLTEKIVSLYSHSFGYHEFIEATFKIEDINLTLESSDEKRQSVITIKLKCNVTRLPLYDEADYDFFRKP